MHKTNRARLMLLSSMAIFGTIGFFVRHINLPSEAIALYRAVLASLLLGLYLLIRRRPIPFRAIRKGLPLLLISGFAMGINWILLFEAYKYTTVSVATLSYYFAPVLVTVFSSLLFKERLSPRQVLCFAMSTIGLILITGIGDLGQGASIKGILLGLGAAVFYASVVLINKFIKNVDGIDRTFLQFLAAVFILIPYTAVSGGLSLGGLDGIGWCALLIVGLVHTGLTYCLYFSSLKELSGQKAAILSYIDPLIAVGVSVFLLKEPLTLPQLLGGLMILGFTLWNELPAKK